MNATSHRFEKPAQPDESQITVRKAEPTIVLEKLKPTISVLSEPSTPLGRLIVILANKYHDRNNQWSKKIILEKVKLHGWDTDGIEHEINRLVQWEILAFQSNGQLQFYPNRVRVDEKLIEVDAEVLT